MSDWTLEEMQSEKAKAEAVMGEHLAKIGLKRFEQNYGCGPYWYDEEGKCKVAIVATKAGYSGMYWKPLLKTRLEPWTGRAIRVKVFNMERIVAFIEAQRRTISDGEKRRADRTDEIRDLCAKLKGLLPGKRVIVSESVGSCNHVRIERTDGVPAHIEMKMWPGGRVSEVTINFGESLELEEALDRLKGTW